MSSDDDLQEARSEAEAILALSEDNLAKLFFEKTMRRNLARTVRHLDKLIMGGGEDRSLGERALKRLGFTIQQ